MSKKIEEILEVIKGVKARWRGVESVSNLRSEVTRTVANSHKVTYQTICDKYTRQLGIKADEFDTLLQEWIISGNQQLQYLLLQHSDNSDKMLISHLFNTLLPITNIVELEDTKLDDEEIIIGLIFEEIAPKGAKQFPDDFLDNANCTAFYEVDLPGMQLDLAPLSQTIITSPKAYFRYQAKNPPEAKYILYAHNLGSKKVKIPKDNLALFKTVKTYERYCDELTRRAFELFLEFTYDEEKSEELTREVARRLHLKGKLPIFGNSRE